MSSLSSLNSNGLTFGGLSTGIDSTKIIEGLTKIGQQKIDTLTARRAAVTDKQSTFAALQGKLFDLQFKSNALARAAGGAFDGRKATSSDDKTLGVAAGTAATPGTYSITVNSLAQANQVASAGFADTNAALKTGTFTVQVGSGTATTVTLDAKNATLQGLADAINAAGGDVRAGVINDGSANPYRLTLTAARAGAANTIAVTNNLTGGSGASIDPLNTTLQAAADARVTLGSGAGAISVTSGSNSITTLVPGVALNLQKADPSTPITVTVTNDTAAASKAVQDFVSAYNDVIGFIDDRDNFDSATGSAGILLGNRDIADLQDDLRQSLQVAVPGTNAKANRLSAVGVQFGASGKLELDQTKLDAALSGNNGVALGDLKKLFGLTGSTSDTGVQFVFGGSKTKPSGDTPYQVQVTSAATRASAEGSYALPNAITVDTNNNLFSVLVNGVSSGNLALAAGTYTQGALAAAVQSLVNASPPLQGHQVAVDVVNGKLRITTAQFGSGASVKFGSGSALGADGPLGFLGTESGTGTNVSGRFVVNGKTETATGTGQTLTGTAGNANTDGLQVRFTGTAAATADLTVTQGLAGRLNSVLGKYLDAATGKLSAINDGFTAQSDEITGQIRKQNDLLTEKKDELTRRFAEMESAVSKLKGLGASLTALIPKSST